LTATLPTSFQVSAEVSRALTQNQPVVALESTVITHGLPYPENLTLAEDMEIEVRRQGCVPATIAVLDGQVQIGLDPGQLLRLVQPGSQFVKVSLRDFAPAIAARASGGTTVAGTMLAAHLAGIRIFATGGIGGVHHNISRRRTAFDISADLPALAQIPMIVVCAGAKAILDLAATLEYLEMGCTCHRLPERRFPRIFYTEQRFKNQRSRRYAGRCGRNCAGALGFRAAKRCPGHCASA